jgi:uncharacterized membrane protein YgdD (TMEM256/DUF423 family)
MQSKALLCLAALSLLCATLAGAVGAHALILDERALRSFSTAVDFQFFHGLGIIAITIVGSRGFGNRLVWIAAWLLFAGTVLFCGSLYARTFGAPAAVASAAPYGGVAFMLGWLSFAIGIWLRPSAPSA